MRVRAREGEGESGRASATRRARGGACRGDRRAEPPRPPGARDHWTGCASRETRRQQRARAARASGGARERRELERAAAGGPAGLARRPGAMHTYEVLGVRVDFPYPAYPCQLVFMEKVIASLGGGGGGGGAGVGAGGDAGGDGGGGGRGQSALLESPTGTGKTLCLLCASLAWQRHRRERARAQARAAHERMQAEAGANVYVRRPADAAPAQGRGPVGTKVLYASRTHSQLAQVVRELRKTGYRPRTVVLSSREHTCIHSSVGRLRGAALNNSCRAMVNQRACRHHRAAVNLVTQQSEGTAPEMPPMDIEELVELGKREGPCPYFVNREGLEDAELVLLPYHYLLDPLNRRALKGIDWHSSVVIFDEAHNIESVCAEVASFDLPVPTLAAAVVEAERIAQAAEQAADGEQLGVPDASEEAAMARSGAEDAKQLVVVLKAIERALSALTVPSPKGLVERGVYLHRLLVDVGIDSDNMPMLIERMEGAADAAAEAANLGGVSAVGSGTPSMDMVARAIRTLERSRRDSHDYVLYVRDEMPRAGGSDGGSLRDAVTVQRVVSYWCFNPGAGLAPLLELGLSRVVLASGTLAPMESTAQELALPFPVRLENPHVVDAANVMVGVLPTGPSRVPLNSSFKSRDTPSYKEELGNALVNLARVVPDGMLVFFPSYGVLASCVEYWRERGQWDRIASKKHALVEPRKTSELGAVFAEFNAALDSGGGGAVMFAVCRGKVSEGLDFADRAGRCVVVTGIPYAPKVDPKVQLKRDFLDKKSKGEIGGTSAPGRKGGGLTGAVWYSDQAMRAVNQAVGRVIRHRNDYGAILLADERFGSPAVQANMSAWLRPHMHTFGTFGEAQGAMVKFFKAMARGAARGKAAMAAPVESARVTHQLSGATVAARPRAPPPVALGLSNGAGLSGMASFMRQQQARQEQGEYAAPPERRIGGGSLADLYSDRDAGAARPLGPRAGNALNLQAEYDKLAGALAKGSGDATRRQASQVAAGAPASKLARRGGGLLAAARAAAAEADAPARSGPGEVAAQSAPSDGVAYLARVKDALPKDGYAQFKRLLKAYRASSGGDAAIGAGAGGRAGETSGVAARTLQGVVALLRSTPQLLAGFEQFVPTQHKDTFLAAIADTSGAP